MKKSLIFKTLKLLVLTGLLIGLVLLTTTRAFTESYFVATNGTEYVITKDDFDKRQLHKFVSRTQNIRQDKWTVENKFGDKLTFIHNKDYCVYKERVNGKWSTKPITEEEYKVLYNEKIKEIKDSDGNIHTELTPPEGVQRAKLIKYIG